MCTYNRLLGMSLYNIGSMTNDSINLSNSNVCINNINISTVQTLNSTQIGDGTAAMQYVMSGTGGPVGLAQYNGAPADPASDNMVTNYTTQTVDGFKDTFGIIDFVESEKRFHMSNALVVPRVTTTSDRRDKTNVEPIRDAMDKIEQLKGYSYNLDGDGGKRAMGLMAQEIIEVVPSAVHQANDARGSLSVDYNAIVPLLLEGIRELRGEIRELRSARLKPFNKLE